MSGFRIQTEKYSINVREKIFLVAGFYIDASTLSSSVKTKWVLTEAKYNYLHCAAPDHFTFRLYGMKHAVKIVISGILL
jgi:hypothetical protein